MFCLPTFVALGLAAAPAPQPFRFGTKTFKDIQVTCDNTHHCRAIGVMENADYQPVILDLDREAGPEGKQLLTLRAQGVHTFSLDPIRIDGKSSPEIKALPWRNESIPENSNKGLPETKFVLHDGASIRAFLDRVRDARRLSVPLLDPDEPSHEPLVVSLNGLSAALLFVDDLQGRIDTQTAWLKRGPNPESSVPPAPLAPLEPVLPKPPPLTASEQKVLLKRARTLARQKQCGGPEAEKPKVYPLDETHALLFLDCGPAGAGYNSSQEAFTVSRDGKGQARGIVLRNSSGEEYEDALTNATYFPDDLSIANHYLGRSMGDCGGENTWRWDGKVFQLVLSDGEGACGGLINDWPVDWTTRP